VLQLHKRLKKARLFTKMQRKEDVVDIRTKEQPSKKEAKEIEEMRKFRNLKLASKKVELKCTRNVLNCPNSRCKANFWNSHSRSHSRSTGRRVGFAVFHSLMVGIQGNRVAMSGARPLQRSASIVSVDDSSGAELDRALRFGHAGAVNDFAVPSGGQQNML
jgi:hypothetical protein